MERTVTLTPGVRRSFLTTASGIGYLARPVWGKGAFLTRHSSRAVEGPGPVKPPQPIRRDTVRKPGSMEVKAGSKKDEEKKDEPEGELRLEPGMAVIMTVPLGMAKRLRERNARRKAEREAQEKESGKEEDGADE